MTQRMYQSLCTVFTGSHAYNGCTEDACFSHSLLTTDADEVTDYGLQVFTLDSFGTLSMNHNTLFPDAVNCLHACLPLPYCTI